MLIVNMPKPENCERCPLIFRCAEVQGITAGQFISAKHNGYFADFCIIAGELVTCSKCESDGRCCIQEAMANADWDSDDFFCYFGERKDGE